MAYTSRFCKLFNKCNKRVPKKNVQILKGYSEADTISVNIVYVAFYQT